ncbi:MAG: Arm DNA-binding domain-containing protein [Desulfovibrionaceae bacterium]
MSGKLTVPALRQAQPSQKPVRLFDGEGLYLEVSPAGSKLWRLKYRFRGKERRMALGKYPEVELADARLLKADAKELLRQGIDPGDQRKEEKARAKEQAAREAADRKAAEGPKALSVSIFRDGRFEIWKGRKVLRLSRGEARQVSEILTGLLKEES